MPLQDCHCVVCDVHAAAQHRRQCFDNLTFKRILLFSDSSRSFSKFN